MIYAHTPGETVPTEDDIKNWPAYLDRPKHHEAASPKNDMVNHPAHYKFKNGLETIDVIEAFTDGLVGIEATDTGNIIKYICRWKSKNGVQDLKKARWYLDHLINHMEKESD